MFQAENSSQNSSQLPHALLFDEYGKADSNPFLTPHLKKELNPRLRAQEPLLSLGTANPSPRGQLDARTEDGMGGWWPATPCPESQKCSSNSVTVSTACSPPPLKPGKRASTEGAPGKPQEKVPTFAVQRAKRHRYQGKREKGFIYYTSNFKAPKDIHFPQVSSRKAGLKNATAGVWATPAKPQPCWCPAATGHVVCACPSSKHAALSRYVTGPDPPQGSRSPGVLAQRCPPWHLCQEQPLQYL